MLRQSRPIVLLAGLSGWPAAAGAETGYDLWLRYPAVGDRALLASYRKAVTAIVPPESSPTADVAVEELKRGLLDLLAVPVPVVTEVDADGGLVLDTPR